MPDTFLLFIQPIDDSTGLLCGAVAVPPCFRPTEEFLDYVEEMGFAAALMTGDDFATTWGGPLRESDLVHGALIMGAITAVRDADVYAQSTLN